MQQHRVTAGYPRGRQQLRRGRAGQQQVRRLREAQRGWLSEDVAEGAKRKTERAVLFYATDDDQTEATAGAG